MYDKKLEALDFLLFPQDKKIKITYKKSPPLPKPPTKTMR
jgi:hypothetical protein